MKTYLQVKEATLAAETRIIRNLERSKRRNAALRQSLHNHRMNVVRPEARSTHLALGFLRGRSHADMEGALRPKNKGHVSTIGYTRTHPNWERIKQIIKKYGVQYFSSESVMLQKFAEWQDTAIGVH